MKLVYKVSPNYRDSLSTQEIMIKLCLGLLVVFIASDVYYFVNYGVEFGLRAIGLLISSIISAILTEVVWCYFTKKNIKESLMASFPWVTAIILTLMCQVSVSYYALIVSTILCIFFGKLVFGGFGQNVFNPAALGRSIIAASFTSSIVNDFVTGATPTSTISSMGWFMSEATFNNAIGKFNGLFGLFLGTHSGAIGETSVLIILLVGIYLAFKNVIDYRVPVVYICTLFFTTLIIGLINGQGIWFPLFHVLTGGAMFGAVFMMTDPVTNPTVIPGRIVFAMGCAFLTVLIRINANLPEGVMYSILLMNALTPAIEKIFDCGQIQDEKKNLKYVLITLVCGILICVGMSLYKVSNTEVVSNNSANVVALYK